MKKRSSKKAPKETTEESLSSCRPDWARAEAEIAALIAGDPVVIWLLRIAVLTNSYGEGSWHDEAKKIVDAWDRGGQLPEILDLMGLAQRGQGRKDRPFRANPRDMRLFLAHAKAAHAGDPNPIQTVADKHHTSTRTVERALARFRNYNEILSSPKTLAEAVYNSRFPLERMSAMVRVLAARLPAKK